MKTKYDRVIYAIFSVLVISLFSVLLYGLFVFNGPQMHHSRYAQLTSWVRTYDNGEQTSVSIPQNIKTYDGELLKLSATLPETVLDETYISITNKRKIDIYIDDELRYSFDPQKIVIPGGVTKEFTDSIELTPADSGKSIRLEILCNSGVTNLETIHIGDSLSIEYYFFSRNIILFMFALMLLVASVFIIAISVIYKIITHSGLFIGYSAFVCLLSSLWVVFDSKIFQFIFKKQFIDGPLSYMSVMMIVLPVIITTNYLQKGRHLKYHRILFTLGLANYIIISALHFSGTVSFDRSIIPMNVVLAVIWLLSTCTILLDIKGGLWREYTGAIIGIVILGLSFLADVLFLHYDATSIRGTFSIVGNVIFIIAIILQQLMEIDKYRTEKNTALEQKTAQTAFFANLSHEFRTPINTIMGMNELILRETQEPTIRDYALKVDDSGKLLTSYIGNVLDFSKLEAGTMEVSENNYRTYDLIETIKNTLSYRAGEKELQNSFSVSSSLPIGLCGDEIRIKQIALNLVSNAIKYTTDGSVSCSITSEETDDENVVNLIIDVRDTGIGIKEEDISTIFDRYSRVDKEKTNAIEGSGLGLFIVNKLVDAMNGTINIESVYGIGSRFTASIPQKVYDKTPLSKYQNGKYTHKERAREYKPHFTAPNARILSVDDTRINLIVIEGLLKGTKMNIYSALSGDEAVNLCKQYKFDLILMDHMMPDKDGIQTFREIRETCPLNKNTKVIMVTANALSDFRSSCLELGFTDFVTKPINGKDFERCIESHLPDGLANIQADEGDPE